MKSRTAGLPAAVGGMTEERGMPRPAWLVVVSAVGLASCAMHPAPPPDGAGAVPIAIGPEVAPPPVDAWTFAIPEIRLRRYSRFMLAPAAVHRGPGSAFGDLSDAQVDEIARMLVEESRLALGRRFPVASEPGPETARIRFTLLAVGSTMPLGHALDPETAIGAGVAMIGMPPDRPAGSSTATLTYAVEMRDALSNELLWAAVRSAAPGPFDTASATDTLDSARQVARDVAAKLRSRLNQLAARRGPAGPLYRAVPAGSALPAPSTPATDG